ncbi:MAG: SLBB domain-containing protein [Polyangiaceae bacterium]|nr:SLBB domain-containing protein [Polyangiaceae bacterium]
MKLLGAESQELGTITVREDGHIHLPLIGPLLIAGCDLESARAAIESGYRQYSHHSRIALQLVEAKGHLATIVGRVQQPGTYVIRPGARLVELFVHGGGAPLMYMEDGQSVPDADLLGARLVREGKALSVSIPDAMRGDLKHNIYLRPGDILFVPRTNNRRISVIGEVQLPKSLVFQRGMRLTEALARAGGPSGKADNGDIRIIRGNLTSPKIYTASLAQLLDGDGPDIELAPGDVVFVTRHWTASAAELTPSLTTALMGLAVTSSVMKN